MDKVMRQIANAGGAFGHIPGTQGTNHGEDNGQGRVKDAKSGNI